MQCYPPMTENMAVRPYSGILRGVPKLVLNPFINSADERKAIEQYCEREGVDPDSLDSFEINDILDNEREWMADILIDEGRRVWRNTVGLKLPSGAVVYVAPNCTRRRRGRGLPEVEWSLNEDSIEDQAEDLDDEDIAAIRRECTNLMKIFRSHIDWPYYADMDWSLQSYYDERFGETDFPDDWEDCYERAHFEFVPEI